MYQIQKKRKSGWVFFILFLCAFVVGLGLGFVGRYMNLRQQKSKSTPHQVSEQIQTEGENTDIPDRTASVNIIAEAEPTPTVQQPYYVVAQSDKVCVFFMDENGNWRFSHNLAIELDALREEDKQLFYEGITLSSKQELSSLVEDFSS
ncbi:MAG: hypothetical protein IKD21_04605 [Clostridia bacterium]|nr:hypothetical protein [Clostridia bacterium]